jgi:hypothetical protein
MKTAREVAEEMVTADEYVDCGSPALLTDADDLVPLEPQARREDAVSIVDDARGIIERLVIRSRAEGAETKAAECEAWRRLAIARGVRMGCGSYERPAQNVADAAIEESMAMVKQLAVLGINAYTGEPIR